MKKMNNKGFSLVELIVVIAIMAVLAVTFAPRLTAYVEKAKKASDREVVHAILTATKIGVLEEDIEKDFKALLADDTYSNEDTINLTADLIYTVANKAWTRATLKTPTNKYAEHIQAVLGDFDLKSNEATSNTVILIEVDASDNITVSILYDGLVEDYSITDTLY